MLQSHLIANSFRLFRIHELQKLHELVRGLDMQAWRICR